MKAFFKELFEYNHWTNQQIAEVFNTHPDKTSAQAVKLFNHVLNAHSIWNNRIDSLQPSCGVWEIRGSELLENIDLTNFKSTLKSIETIDLHNVCKYTNSKGLSFTNSVRDILFHIINHSTYHRAQIATEFKQAGLEPLPTDYIFFKR